MKSTIINQLITNYIQQKNSNKNLIMKKLPTQANHNMKKKINKDIKNPSIKTRRKPRCLNTNKNYFEPNKKKLKSVSRYKNAQKHQNHKIKIIPKYPKQNMNRTICNDAYGNIIANIHDRNLSAPSLNYETNLNNKKNLINKKKKNNIIKLYKGDKKEFDENLINKDNYAYHMKLDNNSIKDKNNFERNNNIINSVTYNKDSQASNNNLVDLDKSGEYDPLIKVKTLEMEEKFYSNVQKNNLNIKNFYKNINKNKSQNENIDNSKNDLSNFIKDIEAIQNKRETIALLKEQLKGKDNISKLDNKQKLNKTENTIISTNSYKTNNIFENRNKYKNNNTINLINKGGYATSNFNNYNKYVLNKKNKNKNINKTNNNSCYNDTSNVSKGLTPNKNISITSKGNINLSNSSNNKTINISTNITNNNNNNFGKKIDLTDIYGGKNDKEENDFRENNIKKENKEEKLINDKIEDKIEPNNNNKNSINKFYTENNFDVNNIVISGNKYDDEAFSYKSNDMTNKISDKIDLLYKTDNAIENDNKNNLDINNKKANYSSFQKPNKNINNPNRETEPFSLNTKNKKSTKNKIKEKKGNNFQRHPKAPNNKKRYISKNKYSITNKINEINPLSSRFNTINSDRCNNFEDKNKKRENNKDVSYDISNKNRGIFSKIRLAKPSKSKDMNKKKLESKLKKKNSCKPYINKNRSVDKISDEKIIISPNKVKKFLTKGGFLNKSIYKIGVICEGGEVVFGEKKINQDNYFNYLINDDLRFIGVCDGHGEYGHHVSNYLRNNLPYNFEKTLQKLYKMEENSANLVQNEMSEEKNKNLIENTLEIDENKNNNNIFDKMKMVFEKAFSKTDQNLSQYCHYLNKNGNENDAEEDEESVFDVEYSGSTCVSLLIKEKNMKKIYIANVGDSRAIMIKEQDNNNWYSYQLSRDHKPTEKDEAQRILDYDGEIEKIEDDEGNWTGPLRVWMKGSDGPGLAMTRSFGDEIGTSVGVVSEPEVTEYKIKDEDRAIIIASDGLFEYMSNEEVANVVKKLFELKDANIIARELYNESIIRWKLKDQGIDDITIICILLKSS